jgi:hypothetical protein
MSKATAKEILKNMAAGQQLRYTSFSGYSQQKAGDWSWQSVHQGSAKKLINDGHDSV